jgi:hypothetical protein
MYYFLDNVLSLFVAPKYLYIHKITKVRPGQETKIAVSLSAWTGNEDRSISFSLDRKRRSQYLFQPFMKQ